MFLLAVWWVAVVTLTLPVTLLLPTTLTMLFLLSYFRLPGVPIKRVLQLLSKFRKRDYTPRSKY